MILTLLILSILASFIYSYLTKGAAKRIKRNGWQMRLIRWTINFEPNFKGYCPLFWTTWICIFLVPFSILIHSTGFVIKLFKECFKEDGSEIKESPKKPAYFIMEYYFEYGINSWGEYDEWFENNPNWRDEFLAERAKKQAAEVALELKNKKAEDRKKRIMAAMEPALNISRYLVIPSLMFVAAIAAYYVYKFALQVAASALSIGLWPLIKAVIILASAAFVTLFVYYLYGKVKKMATLTKKVEKLVGEEEKDSNIREYLNKLFDFICIPVVFLGKLYQKECPIIEWADEAPKDKSK